MLMQCYLANRVGSQHNCHGDIATEHAVVMGGMVCNWRHNEKHYKEDIDYINFSRLKLGIPLKKRTDDTPRKAPPLRLDSQVCHLACVNISLR